MATVYILHSIKLNKYYTGSCNDITQRMEQHLSKSYGSAYTKNTEDWEIYLMIENLEYEQARQIETHIKKMKSKIYIENLLKYPEIIERLKLKYK